MSNNQSFIISLLVLSVLFISCNKKTNKQEEARKIVAEWIGKEIKFPDNMIFSVYGQDTLVAPLSEVPYKILLYSDSTGCTSCKLKLLEWQALIHEADTVLNGKLSFVFCFYPKHKKEMEYLLLRDHFNYPVFIDENNKLNQLNRFPVQMEYQCFLLDQKNKVVSIGNPVLNRRIWDLYKQIVTGEVTQ
ncbi:MAG: hypothetical protein VB102_07605 [Paludibacter sp.]|nr:hypothetical protein [Paludibacter sp.]